MSEEYIDLPAAELGVMEPVTSSSEHSWEDVVSALYEKMTL